ncbi:tigger transposable element-derived protein, partial [Rhizoctonia solani AG-3 Rhs1AP]
MERQRQRRLNRCTETARLQQILQGYEPSEVYNFDETAHFFRQPPKHALGFEQMSGLKDDKTRMSLGLCSNADGSDKRAPLFIGYHQKPRAFKGYTAAALGYEYSFNDTAWMRTDVFEKWALSFDADMRRQNRQVLLLCDNASSHKKFDATKLTNPLDAGVIRCFKAHYRRRFLRKVLERDSLNLPHVYRIDQLEAMQLSVQAWSQVAPSTIVNCWRHTGICPPAFFAPAELPVPEDPVMLDLQDDLNALTDTQDGEFLSAQELVDIDRNVQTEEEITDEMIIHHIRSIFNLV